MTNTLRPTTTTYRRAMAQLTLPALVLALCALLFGAVAQAGATTTTTTTTDVIPCSTDAECAYLNPELGTYGTPTITTTTATLYPDGWVGMTFGPEAQAELAMLLDYGYAIDPGTHEIYAPVWSVHDVPGGTLTVTPLGAQVCVDWETTGAECSDETYIPWLPGSFRRSHLRTT